MRAAQDARGAARMKRWLMASASRVTQELDTTLHVESVFDVDRMNTAPAARRRGVVCVVRRRRVPTRSGLSVWCAFPTYVSAPIRYVHNRCADRGRLLAFGDELGLVQCQPPAK